MQSKKRIKSYVLKIVICVLVSNFIALSLSNILYYSNKNNNENIVTSDVINGKMNNLYTTPSEYSTLLSKLNTTESYFPKYTTPQSTTANSFNSSNKELYMGKDSFVSNYNYINFYYNGVIRGSISSGSSSSAKTNITANGSTGTQGAGNINIYATDMWSGNVAPNNTENPSDLTKFDSFGEILSAEPAAVNVANKTYTNLGNITITPGTWLLYFGANFAANASGYRKINLGTGSANSSNISEQAVTVVHASSAYSFIHSSIPVTVTSNTKYYLKAYQTSGSTLSTTGRIYAIRIRK